MIVPVRCFSCGKPLAGFYNEFKERTAKGEDAGKVLDEMKIKRYCCRKALLTAVDMVDEVMKYSK